MISGSDPGVNELGQSETGPTSIEPLVGELAEPRWPAVMVFFTGWWLPATTARRTQHVSLRYAFAIHLLGVVLGCLVLWGLVAWEKSVWYPSSPFANRLQWVWWGFVRDYSHELNRSPVATLAFTAGGVLLFEVSFVALGLLLAPWGAADERIRASIANGMRQVWLHTADLAVICLAAGLIAVPLKQAKITWDARASQAMQQWSDTHYPVWPAFPTPPKNVSVNSQQWQDYQKAAQEFAAASAARNQQWAQIEKTRPGLVRYRDAITGLAFMAAGIWWLWVQLRAVGARRRVLPIARPPRPPTCETCGYNLTSLAMEARCPECGAPVRDSIGPRAKPGIPWERRRETGWLRAWCQTAWDAIIRPSRLGMLFCVATRRVDHRRFLALSFLPLFVIGYMLVMGIEWMWMPLRPNSIEGSDTAYGAAPIFGCSVAVFGLVGPLLAAGVVGLILSIAQRRNLVPAAMQMAAYLSGFLTLCVFLSAVCAAFALQYTINGRIFGLGLNLRMSRPVFLVSAWSIPTMAMVVPYIILLYRGTRGARFVNR
jgi:hypothetical protein